MVADCGLVLDLRAQKSLLTPLLVLVCFCQVTGVRMELSGPVGLTHTILSQVSGGLFGSESSEKLIQTLSWFLRAQKSLLRDLVASV